MRRKEKAQKKNRIMPDIHLVVFLVLLTTICLERALTLFIFSAGLECLDQRDLSIGSFVGENGVYDWFATIAALSIVVTLIGLFGSFPAAKSFSFSTVAIAIVNSMIALGILSLSALPWAYFNVEHPLSDRIYSVRNAIAPSIDFETPAQFRRYSPPNPLVWNCVSDDCSDEPDDLNAEFVHRDLNITLKNVIVSDCMTPEFNIATKRAIGGSLEGYSGDKRRFARVYFDELGRFVGPKDRSVFTPYLRKQLSQAQLEPSVWELEELLITLYEHEQGVLSQNEGDKSAQ